MMALQISAYKIFTIYLRGMLGVVGIWITVQSPPDVKMSFWPWTHCYYPFKNGGIINGKAPRKMYLGIRKKTWLYFFGWGPILHVVVN